VIPEGYFSKAPGVIAKCPPGEYKTGLGAVASCEKCPLHVTTAADGSKKPGDCTYVQPSFYATAFDAADNHVSETALCRRGRYCLGGNTQSRRRNLLEQGSLETECPAGTYTENPGASSQAQCCKFTCPARTLSRQLSLALHLVAACVHVQTRL
jgi:hypothetical protein